MNKKTTARQFTFERTASLRGGFNGLAGKYVAPSKNRSGPQARRTSCGSLVFLVLAARDDLQRFVQQWPLQCLRLFPRRAQPGVALLRRRQDHRHRLGMDWLDDRVRRGGQETVDAVRT